MDAGKMFQSQFRTKKGQISVTFFPLTGTVFLLRTEPQNQQKKLVQPSTLSLETKMNSDFYCADFAFLDSGTGGIPDMLEKKKKHPLARCVYLGDTAHFPYGEKSIEEITGCAAKAVSMIIKNWNPKTLIIACNTISVTSLDQLRSIFPELPIVGTVPAIKLAAKVTKNKKIGFLATNASVNSPYSKKLIEDFAGDCDIFSRGDPKLVDFIEKDFFTATLDQKKASVSPAVDYFASRGCDVIILGCTHFTHIAEIMQTVAGDGIKVIDSREGVSNQAIRIERSDGHKKTAALEKPFRDMSFFVTAASPSEEKEYRLLCERLDIPWGGIST